MRLILKGVIVLGLVVSLVGCKNEPGNEVIQAEINQNAGAVMSIVQQEKTQRLLINATIDVSVEEQEVYTPEGDAKLYIRDFEDATIQLNGTPVPLTDAVQTGYITPAEIVLLARIDAANGICSEKYTSEKGLSRFYYQYNNFMVTTVYDVYESPNGKDHLVTEVTVCRLGGEAYIDRLYVDEDGIPLGREDWAITFAASNVSGSGLALSGTLNGGQKIGELHAESYCIVDVKTGKYMMPNGTSGAACWLDSPVLIPEGEWELCLEWETVFGQLPAGEYALLLTLVDVYDAEQVHPLMQNYYDHQDYTIEFTVTN